MRKRGRQKRRATEDGRPIPDDGGRGVARGRVCGKVVYPSRRGAKAAAKVLGASGRLRPGSNLLAYYCEPCDGWHIGNAPAGAVEPRHKRIDAGSKVK